MIPVTEKELKKLIKEGQEAGKDVTNLKNTLQNLPTKPKITEHVEKIKIGDKEITYCSTGPIRKEDFEK